MSRLMTTTQAAQALGVAPRQLRRFLRDHAEDWPSVGIGGRYWFSQSDLNRLAQGMGVTMKRLSPDRPGLTVEEMIQARYNPQMRERQLKMRAERRQRLEQQVHAAGLWGISTLQERR